MEALECAKNHPKPELVVAGLTLCNHCIRQAKRNLRLVAELHEECLHRISPLPRQLVVERVSGSHRRGRTNHSALDIRHHIQTVLESWAEVVLEGIGPPAPLRSVPRLTRFLAVHLEWLAAQPPAADFVTELEDLVAEARRIVDPAPSSRSTTLGRCVVPGCAGIISTTLQNTENSGRATIGCSAGHSWAPHEWLLLRRRMRSEQEVSTV